MSEKLDTLFEKYLEKQLEAAPVAKVEEAAPVAQPEYVTVDVMKSMLAEFSAQVSKEIAESAPTGREEGVGRVGTQIPESDIEADPVDYLAKKAARGEEFTQDEKTLAWELTKAVLADGLIYGDK